jgi:hypothetical protein
MDSSSVNVLTQHLKTQRERLVVLRAYQRAIDDPYVKPALSFVIEDTLEAIARTSSRLRQLGESPAGQLLTAAAEEKLRLNHRQRDLAEMLKFVWHALKDQLEWYNTHLKTLRNDADTQAIFVALAEQTRVRLERWKNLLEEMKVSPGK